MNTRALSEVYAILNVMDSKTVNKISPTFIKFIKNNRDVLYTPKFDKIPNNFDNLEHDTKVIFALIYKKYFYNNDKYNNINFETKEKIQKECTKLVVVKKANIIDRLKQFIHNIISRSKNIK